MAKRPAHVSFDSSKTKSKRTFLGRNSSSGKRRYEEDPPHRCVEHTNGRVREFSASCDILVPKAKTSRTFLLL